LKKLENLKLRGLLSYRTSHVRELEERGGNSQLLKKNQLIRINWPMNKTQAMIQEGMIQSEENAILTQPPPSTQSTVLDEGASTSKSIRKKRKKSLVLTLGINLHQHRPLLLYSVLSLLYEEH
ncbi:hypothetical protein V2J09_004155, partial [Rumex salicifolius]